MIKLASALAIALTMTSAHVHADGISHDTLPNTDSSYTTRLDSHAPIRVMGDHMLNHSDRATQSLTNRDRLNKQKPHVTFARLPLTFKH